MRYAVRPIGLILSTVFVVSAPARAASLTMANVAQVVTVSDGRPELRLRSVSQTQSNVGTAGTRQTPLGDSGATSSSASPNNSGNASSSSNDVLVQSGTGGNVQTVQVGDVTGTICDCGEIAPLPPPIPGAGFPKLALLALAAIPLAFIRFGNRNGSPESFINPTLLPPAASTPSVPSVPSIPPTPIPEPMTLLLLGSGLAALAANARRRRTQAQQFDCALTTNAAALAISGTVEEAK